MFIMLLPCVASEVSELKGSSLILWGWFSQSPCKSQGIMCSKVQRIVVGTVHANLQFQTTVACMQKSPISGTRRSLHAG